MPDPVRSLLPWAKLAGCVLIVAVLYWAQAVIVPVALAMLFAFVLTPVVTFLQRFLGRVPSVLAVVALTFTVVGSAGYVLTRQLGAVVQDLPSYQQNIRQKIRDVRWMQRGGSVEMLQNTVEDLKHELEDAPKGSAGKPVVVQSQPGSELWSFPTSMSAALAWLATAGLVIVLVIFILLERQGLRNRLIGLFGHGRLALATKAMDEATWRVSRYLLVQSMINLAFGVGVAVGLTAIGLPYVLLWASLAAALRFIPYIGPWIGALSPVLVSLAVFGGWTRPLMVLSLFVGLELCTNLVLESVFYAGAAGVSQTALIIAVAFWTWLWGPLGLFMATPLTVCLVVIGKYVPGFEFVTVLMADEPVLDADIRFYQRLLAGDHSEASELIDEYAKTHPLETVYDAFLLPALTYAEQDRLEGRLSPDEEQSVVEASAELLDELTLRMQRRREDGGEAAKLGTEPIGVLAWPANGEGDVLALRMFASVLQDAPVRLEALARPILASEVVSIARDRGFRAVCIVDLPPSAPSKSRYLVKRLRSEISDVKILIGRWGAGGDEAETATLLAAGADRVDSRMLDTRDQLCRLLSIAPVEARAPELKAPPRQLGGTATA